jgi:hypothetical protein
VLRGRSCGAPTVPVCTTVLTSPDSVSKVAAFYSDVLEKDGWQVRSSSVSSYHGSFNAHRNNEGVSISVYPHDSGSGISITTYPP